MRHRAALLLALLLSSRAWAQDAPVPVTQPVAEDLRDLMGARAYGMGGAWRAMGVGAETGTGNPATLSIFRTYRVEITGAWDWAGKDAFAMASVADSSTSLLAAGVTYQVASFGKGPTRSTAHFNTLALSLPLADSFLVGVSTRYLVMRGARTANAVTGDAGILFRPTQLISLGLSAHNLIDTGNPELTRYYSLHGSIIAGIFSAAADVRADFTTNSQTTLTYSGGVEFLLGKQFPLRAGYTWDGFTRSSQIGAGLGLQLKGGGIDLAYRHDIGGENGRLLALTFKVQVK